MSSCAQALVNFTQSGYHYSMDFKPRFFCKTRDLVRIRDKFTCQDCGAVRTPEIVARLRTVHLDVHHLEGLCGERTYDAVAMLPLLITLCRSCHKKRDDISGRTRKRRPLFGRKEQLYKLYMSGETQAKLARDFGVSRQAIFIAIAEFR
jgi:hypothetical protein